MKKVDLLFNNAIVLTMNEDFQIFDPGSVAVTGDSIVAAGPTEDISKEYQGTETVDCSGKVLMPGLVNVHTHVPMTLLRGLADDLRLDVWLMGYVMPVEREFVTPEFVRLGTLLSCAEMIRSGTTCFADMYYFEDDIAKATSDAGLRGICGQTVLKFPTPDSKFFEEAVERARTFIQKWKNHPLIVPSVAPHAPYTCTPEIFKACVNLAREFDVPLQIHLAETSFEVDNLRKEQGMPVIPYMKNLGLFEAKVIAAHCVHIDEGEIRALAKAKAGIAHNPSSNLKLASGAAPVKKMLDLKGCVGIGTDGPASNNDLDMFEEMRLASLLGKLSTGDPTAIPAKTTVLMATRMGAQALHVGNITGSIQSGKRADMIVVDITGAHNSPRFHRDPNGIYAQLVYAAKSSDVTDTMVNGKWLMRDRVLKTLQEQDLIAQSREFAQKIDAFLAARESSVLSKLVAIGGAMEQESFEIQIKVRIDNRPVILDALQKPEVEIQRARHYRQFDTYFLFKDPSQGRIRYREDEFIDERGCVTQVRPRLTLLGEEREHRFPKDVLLSRSRYYAPGGSSLRFYREYFQPISEVEIQKDRLRYLIKYKDTDFFINIDALNLPRLGDFLEIKSATWSFQDAQQKSNLLAELLEFLGAGSREPVNKDYFELVQEASGR